jgi:DNA-binding transcriptional MerR regulator
MELLTTSKVALMLGMTSDNVRYLERTGRLPSIRVERGNGEFMRLFFKEHVEQFQQQRAAEALARQAQRAESEAVGIP